MVRYYARMPNQILKAWQHYRSLTGLRYELATLGLCLAASLVLLPIVIWLAGQFFLGDYVRSPSGAPTGGPFALWVDYLRGLAQGSLGYWITLLGPWLLLLGLRGSRWLLRM
ncbi:MAG: hypothetical protein QM696_04310 [Steroidobacteraceae bacterium]